MNRHDRARSRSAGLLHLPSLFWLEVPSQSFGIHSLQELPNKEIGGEEGQSMNDCETLHNPELRRIAGDALVQLHSLEVLWLEW